MLTLLMWREVQPMGFVTNYCLHPGLQALLAFLSSPEQGIKLLGLLLTRSTGQHMASRNGLA